jgi:hypothetical protein
MNARGLTKLSPAARTAFMQSIGQGPAFEKGFGRWGRGAWSVAAARLLAMLVGASMLSGCVSVTAPDKPIVIELNINIKQDIVYSLAPDAKSTIESNSGIF